MSTPTIENIIVVMLENRSYDNMLGGLYLNSNSVPYKTAPAGQANLNGLADANGNPGNYSNPYPSSNSQQPIPIGNQTTPTQIGGTGPSYPPTTIPVIDPGEPFGDMAWQITGSKQSSNPYVSWPPASTANLMQGFTGDYANQHGVCVTPPAGNYADVMNYFTPAQVPVTSWLANKFGVCDQWFASAPTHTFANRAFAHSAAPGLYWESGSSENHSFIDDPQYIETQWNLPSIFYMLDAAYPETASSPNWKVYFHDYAISLLTVPYVMEAAITNGNANGNLATYDNTDWGNETPQPITWLLPREQTALKKVATTFLEDLQNNALPKYSFIEPRYTNGRTYSSNPSGVKSITPNSNPANCNHPGASNYPGFEVPSNPVGPTNPPIDVANGEAFLQQLYNALNQSTYWDKTLLIITYDEHGGCYDHVPPPVFQPLTDVSAYSTDLGMTIETTVPPGSKNPTSTTPGIDIPAASNLLDETSKGFRYNVYGCRVPTIVVSPYIQPGTQISPQGSTNPFDHASIIRTVWDIFFTNGNPTNPPAVSSLTNRDAAAPSLYGALDFSINNNPGQL